MTFKLNQRISRSLLFTNLEKKKAWREFQAKDIWLSLNLEKRKNNKEKSEQELLSLENSLRKELGLETYQTYKDFINREEDPDILDIDHEILRESANILTDFIEYSYQPVVASLKSTG